MKLMLECGQRLFPFDYPETKAGRAWMTNRAHDEIDVYVKLPPSKRPNYQALKQPAPFLPISIFKNDFAFAKIIPVHRGVIETNSLIYLPTKGDFDRLAEVTKIREFWEELQTETNFNASYGKSERKNLDFNAEYFYLRNKLGFSDPKITLNKE
jgi:hypothetical protein